MTYFYRASDTVKVNKEDHKTSKNKKISIETVKKIKEVSEKGGAGRKKKDTVWSRMSWYLMNKHAKDDRLMKETKKYFIKADTDGDGEITKEEWYDVLKEGGMDVSM